MNNWIVNVKGSPESGRFEITVLRKDNKHGQGSYGWIGEDKLLITRSGEPPCPMSSAVWNRLVNVANDVARELNADERRSRAPIQPRDLKHHSTQTPAAITWHKTSEQLPTHEKAGQVEVVMWSPDWATWLKGMYSAWLDGHERWATYNSESGRLESVDPLMVPEYWAAPGLPASPEWPVKTRQPSPHSPNAPGEQRSELPMTRPCQKPN